MSKSNTFGVRLTEHESSMLEEYKVENGFDTISSALRHLIHESLYTNKDQAMSPMAKAINDAKNEMLAKNRYESKFMRANYVLSVLLFSEPRLDTKKLSAGQLSDLCLAVGDALAIQGKDIDIDRALAVGRKNLRVTKKRKAQDELLEYVADKLNSQVIFNTIDKTDLEDWISSMAKYRATKGKEEMFSNEGELGRQRLVALLSKMDIRTAKKAAERFDGSWYFSNETGWTQIAPELLGKIPSVYPGEYTKAWDSLDPNQGNYYESGIEPDKEVLSEHEHERDGRHVN